MRDALEANLVANPDDIAGHAAYADYLIEQGDPRGEFVRVQLALEDESLSKDERDKLRSREKELLAAHEREWLGDVAPVLLDGDGLYGAYGVGYPPTLSYARGWLARIDNLWLDVPGARLLARGPQLRLLSELNVSYACGEGEANPWEPGDDVPDWARDHIQFVSLFPLLRSEHLGNIRKLRVGTDPEQSSRSSHALGHAVAALVAKMSRIEQLRLFTREVDARELFALKSLTNLRRLDYWHDHQYPLRILAANPTLTNLERLDCYPHQYVGWEDQDRSGRTRGSYLPLDEVAPLFRSPHLGKLTHLALRESNMGDAGVRVLVESGMLARLRVLDLSHGAITDRGAKLLARHGRRLEALNLGDNALTPAGVRALREANVPVTADAQHAAGDDRYLYAGEFE